MKRYISKLDGSRELFDEEKIMTSLLKAGTDKNIADNILKGIKKNISDLTQSKEIYEIAFKHLTIKQPDAALKYTLKKAIFDLGPTGYVFERYLAKVLNAHGYKTEVGIFIKGSCVDHEVDVAAEKNGEHFMIECKYHNNIGTKSDVKTALYISARFLDIKNASKAGLNRYNFSQGWLATNTKCTTDAIKYANCVKLNIVAWHYPHDNNLEYYIESKKLYPVSILPGLGDLQKDKLFENKIYSIQDLLEEPQDTIEKLVNLDITAVRKLYAEAALLLS